MHHVPGIPGRTQIRRSTENSAVQFVVSMHIITNHLHHHHHLRYPWGRWIRRSGKRGSGNRGKRETMESEHVNNMLLNGLYVIHVVDVVSKTTCCFNNVCMHVCVSVCVSKQVSKSRVWPQFALQQHWLLPINWQFEIVKRAGPVIALSCAM